MKCLDRRLAVMALGAKHHFQLLTKRCDRMREYMSEPATPMRVWDAVDALLDLWHDDVGIMRGILLPRFRNGDDTPDALLPALAAHGAAWGGQTPWPLVNVSLGVSVHDQPSADEAIPALLDTPAAIRFVSYEPALGPVDWRKDIRSEAERICDNRIAVSTGAAAKPRRLIDGLDLIIAGDESGAGKRPADPDWYRQTRDQCAAAGTHFFLKQMHVGGKLTSCPELDGQRHTALPEAWRALL